MKKKEIGLSRAFELAKKKMEICRCSFGYVEYRDMMRGEEELMSFPSECAFCHVYNGYCALCIVEDTCHGSYANCDYEVAIEELEQRRKDLGID